ncbi:MAG: nucleotide exchange factor GrpE [Hoeflea sp.]|uniref:nucleotide exchange factor GrpE n=1 Tax=Hoeflea sp. TaxID=1940281 RepID=UPI001D25377D|nr:nucleotide exchange factor GrpE [Hoeflea sp.]MBU4531439.1 nucleotide exchange factor GrpE [Alphaproteobacteria bacterium]MBU4544296.1 nucleotide exchange factor GrpE [Alphaproteobacteria bacterium]MBU4550467.1 nucleotide exchange factor GrpE [Alphaproteobacteria bacterium]MBV1724715.1 nucleotide exchange factor GrpE [Hoeflea sp.]MBV1760735.1 nucleotide exchange factor GrpE [Hoeflea sp.]
MSDESQGRENTKPQADAAPKDGETVTPMQADDDPMAALAADIEQLKDQRLRMAADMENLRRRTAREISDAKSYAISGFARDMLQVSDNLQRALAAVPEQADDATDNGLKTLVEGVELTERAMATALERHGVRKLEPMGQKFDPNFHQAMYEVPNTEVPNNTVVDVVQPGYVIGDRMLRPAMVGVAKGGPKEMAVAAEPGPSPQAEKDA